MKALTDLDDPCLPGLPSVQQEGPGMVLAHKPGRRATVVTQGASGTRIAKLFSRSEFDAALTTTRASSRQGRTAPRLLTADTCNCVLWLEHVAGASLDAVDLQRQDRAIPKLGHVVATVHSASTAGLPRWDAEHPAHKLRQRFEAALEVAPQVVEPASWLVDQLARALPTGTRTPVTVHGDVSLRNIMHDEATDEVRLVDWDRTSVGPAEVDLAPIIGLLGSADLVLGYRTAGGRVDTALLARLVLMNRLTRALRRVHRGADGPEAASRQLGTLLEEVAHRRR